MKQFAFPIGVKCADGVEHEQCLAIIKNIGDRRITEDTFSSVYNYLHIYTEFARNGIYNSWGGQSCNMHYIDHFNPALIRDIASVCTNDTWQDGEVYVFGNKYTVHDGSLVGTKISIFRRPTIAEICEHYGYEIKGRDIVKKQEKISNCDKSYCETAMRLNEATAEINRLKSENSELKEKLEAVTDVDNQELERLRREISELKVKCMTFQDAYNTARNREIKLKDLLEDIVSEMD